MHRDAKIMLEKQRASEAKKAAAAAEAASAAAKGGKIAKQNLLIPRK